MFGWLARFSWNFGAFFACLGETDGDGLFAALHRATFPAFPGFQGAALLTVHSALDTLAGGFAVLAPTGSASRTGCHFPLLLFRMWARTGLSVARPGKQSFR